MINMVVFDMAGTVVDENNVVYKSLQEAIIQGGYDCSLDLVLRDGSGKEKLQAIRDVMANSGSTHSESEYLNIFANFKSILDRNYRSLDIKGMPGSLDGFHKLRKNGVSVAFDTGYNREMAEFLISRIGWREGREYDLLVTASDVSESRPHPAMILEAMTLGGIEIASEVAKVGDSAIDIDEGKNAGCGLTFGITTGAQTREQLQAASPDFVVDNIHEVIEVVIASRC